MPSTTNIAEQPPLTLLKGVGPRLRERLERIGITGMVDLLFHLPLRYQDRTRVVPVGSLRPGDEAVVEVEAQLAEVKFGRRRQLLARVADGTGSLTLRLFTFSPAQREMLSRGNRLRLYGEARRGPTGLEMIHPEMAYLTAEAPQPVEEHLTPVYPVTEGLHQKSLRNLTAQALDRLAAGKLTLTDWLPDELLGGSGLPSLADALLQLHRPPPDVSVAALTEPGHPARRRLAFEELLAHNLSLRQLRQRNQSHTAPALSTDGDRIAAFLESLPFELTGAQQRVWGEIAADLEEPVPMQRLVQGDVGSGKTVIAALAALKAVESGFQAAVMAPTELLAEQHQRNFVEWLAPLGIEVVWLSGRATARARREVLARIGSGTARVAVGTHALFQEEVEFEELGVVIVDEQHRFGVHQRLALREKGRRGDRHPHQLIMTATPIPRTLAMTAYADLDCSAIDELPPGRTPVETVVIPDGRRDEVVARVHRACREEGRQAYWVCTLVEESEALQCQAAEATAALLTEALPDLRVGLVHGRLKGEQKEAVMGSFKAGEIDLLIATTVIEVGVNVPNASLMIVENAERLGLAQLHQLRGRVGRGSARSSCLLMYQGPLSQQAKARLATLRETNDGFEIARRDLEIRGPGEVLGTRQSGMMQMRIADIVRDAELLPEVTRAADILLREHPQRVAPLIARWIGHNARYGHV